MTREDRTGGAAGTSSWRAGLSFALLAATLAVVVVGIVLPADAIRWMRMNVGVFNAVMGRVETVQLPVNVVHLGMFLVIGLLARISFRRAGTRSLLLWIAVFAVGTELVQLLIPGREARWEDLAIDLVGGAAGLALGWMLVRTDDDAGSA